MQSGRILFFSAPCGFGKTALANALLRGHRTLRLYADAPDFTLRTLPENWDVLLIDDMVDTAGTITKAANLMLENGAKSVRAIASHAVMSDPASTRVDQSALTEMIFTDSIPYAKKCEKVKVLSVADMFAEAIRRVCSGESISSLYAI